MQSFPGWSHPRVIVYAWKLLELNTKSNTISYIESHQNLHHLFGELLRESKSIIIKSTYYLIGNGASINVWQDPWVPWINGFKPIPKSSTVESNPLMVSQLIDQESFAWKTNLVNDLFDSASANAILSMHLPPTLRSDKLIWFQNPNGNFNVKSPYHLATQPSFPPTQCDVGWKKLRKLNMPKRIKMLIWRIGSNALPTKDNLLHRMNIDDPSCVLCGPEEKSSGHLFF